MNCDVHLHTFKEMTVFSALFSAFRVNLGHLAKKVLLIFQDDCVERYEEALALHGSSMRYKPQASPEVLGLWFLDMVGMGAGILH